jgi:hypothetical protein
MNIENMLDRLAKEGYYPLYRNDKIILCSKYFNNQWVYILLNKENELYNTIAFSQGKILLNNRL